METHSKVSAYATHKESCSYSAFGYIAKKNVTNTTFGFNGEYIDESTRLYLLGNGHRLYNPSLMRFTSPDSMSPFSIGGINPYCYVLNDPINKADPSGRAPGLALIKKQGVMAIKEKKIFSKSLMITAHGVPGKVFVGTSKLGPEEFKMFLEENKVFAKEYKKITLCICSSATAPEHTNVSFGQIFANITDRPVKAFDGTVFSVLNEYKKTGEFEVDIFDKDYRNEFSDEQINISADEPFNYKPKRFEPSNKRNEIRTS